LSESQIEYLFDSIYRGYPIGSFLFWKLTEESFDSYSFFQLLTKYSEAGSSVGELVNQDDIDWNNPMFAVIDGQQELLL
jgi:uncharacterized protein with ParB-like and HNH nuclease domain